MSRFGLCGGTWKGFSHTIDAERCVNWYPVTNPPDALSAMGMIDVPGTKRYTNGLPGTQNRGSFFEPITQRLFTVSGTQFSEIAQGGAITNRGAVVDDGLPASIYANGARSGTPQVPSQLFVTAGGHAYWYDLVGNALNEIDTTSGAALQARVVMGGFCDGYGLALLTDGRFQASNIADFSTWQPAQISRPSTFAENPIAMIVDHQQILLSGSKRGQWFWDSGNIFPFSGAPGGLVEQGIAGSWAWAKADNSIFAIMKDELGDSIVVRFNGYNGSRISHDGIEYTIKQYGTASQAVCWAYQDSGHTFFLIQLPNANTTLVYDVNTNLWHERAAWDSVQGAYIPFRGRNHVLAWGGIHLIGDTLSGELYQMNSAQFNAGAWTFCDFDGTPMIRDRRSPHISNENQWITFPELEILLESGLGPVPPLLDANGNPRGPMLMLQWSDDRGRTWSNIYQIDCGQAGFYKQRVRKLMMGASRDRVYRITASDAAPFRIADGYVEATGYQKPTQRLTDRLRQMA